MGLATSSLGLDDRGARAGAVVWASTFLLQVPCHEQLSKGPDRTAVQRLVATNWLGTAALILRGVLAVRLLVA